MMLSRVAERIYWAARYLERVEDGTRLIDVHGQLLLDLPRETNIGWQQVVEIIGLTDWLPAGRRRASDRDVLRMLLTDEINPSSVMSSLAAARENFRTTRDIVPTEAWRCINELYLYAKAQLRWAVGQRRRHDILSEIVGRAQQLSGVLAGNMSHGPAYQFLRIGTNLERADMTTRVIDVAVTSLLHDPARLQRFANTLWMSTLASVSGYQMYRQYVRRRIDGQHVLAFLFQDLDFPRTVLHCLTQVAAALRPLPNNEAPAERLAAASRIIFDLDVTRLDNEGLHDAVDRMQIAFAELHQCMVDAWFAPDRAA